MLWSCQSREKQFEHADSGKLNSSLILAIAGRRYVAHVIIVLTFRGNRRAHPPNSLRFFSNVAWIERPPSIPRSSIEEVYDVELCGCSNCRF